MGSKNSINPCIKATLGPTFEILGGSGKGCFFGRFPIGEKWAKGSMDVRLGAARGGKTAPGGSATTRQPLGGGVRFGWLVPRAGLACARYSIN